jgi:uncharacterized protein
VDYMKQFVIPFSGLKLGNHEYEFDLGGEFFESFEFSDIHQGRVKISCVMERQERMLIFHFNIKGTVKVPCDRCLEEFDQEINGEQRYIVKFGEDEHEETEEIIVINEKQNHLDLSQLFFEYVILMLPEKKVHGNDENGNSLCNPEVLKKLNELAVDHPIDPRWESLRNLKEKS